LFGVPYVTGAIRWYPGAEGGPPYWFSINRAAAPGGFWTEVYPGRSIHILGQWEGCLTGLLLSGWYFGLDFIPRRKTVIVAGSGRSGTTWLGEMINYRRNYRVLFEPYHYTYVPEWSGFNPRHYLRGDESEARLLASMQAILTGSLANKWTDKTAPPENARHLLIKEIRANLMLYWIHRHYRSVRIVFLVRHPGAVIHSRIKLGWGVYLKEMLSQEKLVQDHLSPFMEKLEKFEQMPVYQQHAIMWCIENYVPLRQFKGRLNVIFYEQLIREPEATLKAVFHLTGDRYHQEVLSGLKKPSAMARPHSAILSDQEHLLDSWRKHQTEEEKRLLEESLRLFGLQDLYDEQGNPCPKVFKKR